METGKKFWRTFFWVLIAHLFILSLLLPLFHHLHKPPSTVTQTSEELAALPQQWMDPQLYQLIAQKEKAALPMIDRPTKNLESEIVLRDRAEEERKAREKAERRRKEEEKRKKLQRERQKKLAAQQKAAQEAKRKEEEEKRRAQIAAEKKAQEKAAEEAAKQKAAEEARRKAEEEQKTQLEADMRWYNQQVIRKAFYEGWVQPKGISGKPVAKVNIVILKDGTIQSAQITKASGDTEMDQSVLAKIRATTKIEPLPKSYNSATYEVTLKYEITHD